MPTLVEQWFSPVEILAIWNRSPLRFCIQGTMEVLGCEYDPDPHHHVFVEVDIRMYGLPRNATIAEAVDFFGWGLERQIELVYLTSDVPDDMVWTGHVEIGMMDN